MIGPYDEDVLTAIADSLEYPHEGSRAAAHYVAVEVATRYPDVGRAFAALATWLEGVPFEESEEVYSALFDLRPSCTLHVGFHVYGEAYQRGVLLAGLVRETSDAGIELGSELADFLPTVLRLLARLGKTAGSKLLTERIVAPGLATMKRELSSITTPWAIAVASLTELFPLQAEHVAKEESLVERIQRELASHA